MGKRKERRLAAKLGANRRVKLDIFAEPPSGDGDNTSANDRIGGDMDQDLHVSDPNSPSSSGHDRGNPLQLLGQYSDDSDDELDMETSKQTKLDSDGTSFNVDVEEHTENVKVTVNGLNDDKGLINQVVTPENMDGNDNKNTDIIYVAADYQETDTNNGAADRSEPTKLTKAIEPDISQNQNNCDLTGGWTLVMHDESNQYYYWNTLTGETSWVVPTNLTVLTTGIEDYPPNNDTYLNMQTETGSYTTAHDTDSVIAQNGDSSASKLSINPSTLSNLSSQAISIGSMTGGHIVYNKEKEKHSEKNDDFYTASDVHASQLIKYCESLLQRLEVLDRSENNHLEDYKFIKKEIEIRISDCNALLAYGSSLLPFWLHTETQIKQLESCISKSEASLVSPDKHDDKLDAAQDSPADVNNYVLTTNPELEVTEEEDQAVSSKVKSRHNSPSSEACVEDSNLKILSKDNTTEGNLVTEAAPQTEDDIDMDIEMEVDEGPVNSPTTKSNFTLEVLPECPPLPPEEEWIPPPPPEIDEPIPPPPPEEPSLPSTIMYPSYHEQYTAYAVPPFDYYSTATAVTGNDYYTKDAVTAALPVSVNEIHEPVAYYDVSGGTIPSAPPVTTGVASGCYLDSGPLSYLNDVKSSSHSVLVGSNVDTGNNIGLKTKLNSELEAATLTESRVYTSQAAFVPSCTVSSGTNVCNGSAKDALPEASSKNKTKAARKKKQTVVVAPSLRSSKIHGLVDKWKAAKEELHSEEDEEPATAYEALEKKHQKEIEQWKSQQIASGEAHDNANFTPLGGDWRERVKRKRAKAKVKAVESPKEIADTGEQPDLVELSKNLPAGWQAYWDDSSKSVYYGNISTSETTWDPPSRYK